MTGFLGSGWAFPVTADAAGGLRTASGEDAVRQSIWAILSTAPGERVMRPDFGCGIHDLVFDVLDAATAGTVTRVVREALTRHEPRIAVLDVYVAPDAAEPGLLLIEINYELRSSNGRANLVYPFYLS
ncbi:MAG: GPW/gp25 family protein [Pseudonocardia sp.]